MFLGDDCRAEGTFEATDESGATYTIHVDSYRQPGAPAGSDLRMRDRWTLIDNVKVNVRKGNGEEAYTLNTSPPTKLTSDDPAAV